MLGKARISATTEGATEFVPILNSASQLNPLHYRVKYSPAKFANKLREPVKQVAFMLSHIVIGYDMITF